MLKQVVDYLVSIGILRNGQLHSARAIVRFAFMHFYK